MGTPAIHEMHIKPNESETIKCEHITTIHSLVDLDLGPLVWAPQLRLVGPQEEGSRDEEEQQQH